MVWRRLFHQDPDPERPDNDDPPEDRPADEKPARRERMLPPHLEEQLGARRRKTVEPDDIRRKLATLKRRHTAALYDIEQGELASAEDNPWKQRIRLLTEALETVDQDRVAAERVEPGPYHPVPATPITGMSVEIENDVAAVRYTVGDERFVYEEPLDWAERGHQITRTELRRTAGDPAKVLPDNTPAEMRDALLHHLDTSLFVLATVLRDRTLEEEPLPEDATLADLARPCPVCGGWTDYRGRCQHCARRAARLQELFRERTKLLDERAAEVEEQHRMAERLPLARRRLADVDTEIAAVERKIEEQDRD